MLGITKFAHILLALSLFGTSFALKTCDVPGPGYFKFLAKTQAQIKPETSVTFGGFCFSRITVSLRKEVNSFVAQISTEGFIGGFLCGDMVYLSSGKTHWSRIIMSEGIRTVVIPFADLTPLEVQSLTKNGMFVLRMCSNVRDVPQSMFMTAKLFVGGWGKRPWLPIIGTHIPRFQQNANRDFVKQLTGYEWKERRRNKFVRIPPKDIKSGDLFFVTRMDGVDQLGHINAGSRAGHVAMALWQGKRLYIVESKQAGIKHSGVYKLTYRRWLLENRMQDANVVFTPLKRNLQRKLNVAKVWEAFKRLDGNDYGFRNYIFTLIDTEDQNMNEMFDFVFASVVLDKAERIFGKYFGAFLYEGWSHRLGAPKTLKIGEIWEQLFSKDMTLGELSAVPEKDGQKYSNGLNFVCSSFVVHLFKEGGLFQGVDIQATEFMPRDVYELAFFDVGPHTVPKRCRKYAPRGYCQVMGALDFDLGKFNYVEPYDHMNEHCPTQGPEFIRPNRC